ncbi:transglutaminase-like enzyme, predicted cysteine protease [Spongiibacter sp. IMCC21906]|uniref:transglutaminase-like domain-containing protein n=1 Tax=Spongiibacter sp. IMCC21906 TaxID=1620392 RepID=UPI00062DD4AA|nr:transglutaminase family protein [Spongiibacter sp. IMCC21906]AKH68216.1 transglutaminase-like enzyme, predicted cysteine protease [Spongiibacter sp. IMCC21906]
MWIETRCELHFDIAVPSPFMLMLRPRSGKQQWIAREEYHLSPMVPVEEFTDLYGNLCQRLVAPVGDFRIETTARVFVADKMDRSPGAPFIEVQNLPDAVLIYLLPSRFCETESFNDMAGQITAGHWLGYDQVAAIENWLRDNIHFSPGSSTVPVSAEEVNQRGFGVCRDLAHLGISLCRSLSIPARMVVGCLDGLEPMDLHAWFEAYVGGRWYTFDATQQQLRGGYIAYGYGRDAADVAIYTQFGPPVLPRYQHLSVQRQP